MMSHSNESIYPSPKRQVSKSRLIPLPPNSFIPLDTKLEPLPEDSFIPLDGRIEPLSNQCRFIPFNG